MRTSLSVIAAVVAATIVGTLSQSITAPLILGVLDGTARPEAVLDFFGKLISALAAIGAYSYYIKRLTK